MQRVGGGVSGAVGGLVGGRVGKRVGKRVMGKGNNDSVTMLILSRRPLQRTKAGATATRRTTELLLVYVFVVTTIHGKVTLPVALALVHLPSDVQTGTNFGIGVIRKTEVVTKVQVENSLIVVIRLLHCSLHH